MNDSESTFEWTASPSVVLEAVEALAVYSNAKGDIVIRQKSSKGIFREEDSIVVVPRDRLEVVIAALERERTRKPVASVPTADVADERRQA